MRQELHEAGQEQPGNVGQGNVPDGQMVRLLTTRFLLGAQIGNHCWAGKQCERVEEFVNHCERDVRMASPDDAFGEERSEVAAPGVARPPQNLFEETPSCS